MSDQHHSYKGSCLCGEVKYTVAGPLRPVTYCHCLQCRKSSGHYFAATACDSEDLIFEEDKGLKWYRASDTAQRGFCGTCGSSLFWKPDHGKHISILAGSLDDDSNLEEQDHIFVQNKGAYYEITDGLPQHAGDYPD